MWKIIDLFFPPRCIVCDGLLKPSEEGVCAHCEPLLQRIGAPYCMKCGKGLREENEVFCADCKMHAHAFESGRALFQYNDAMKRSLYRYKYDGRKEYAAFYGRSLFEGLGDWIGSIGPSCIIPIPLHENRLKKRGYNQAELIALALSAHVHIPVKNDLLCRRTDTKKQKELNVSEREKNLKKAFKTAKNIVKPVSLMIVRNIAVIPRPIPWKT